MEFCNNLNYNWSEGQNISGEQFNLLNNYYKAGKEAYESCLMKSGCSLVSDTVDERLIKSIINNTGKVIDSQNDVGGCDMYPSVLRRVKMGKYALAHLFFEEENSRLNNP